MIVLTIKKEDPESKRIKQRLDNLVLAYKTEYTTDGDSHKAPYIEENGVLIENPIELEKWLTQLEKELNWQRSLSGDGCYIDPDTGNTC